MLKKMIKVSIAFFVLYFFIGFIWIIKVHSTKLKSYEYGNQSIDEQDIEIIYNDPIVEVGNSFDVENVELKEFLSCYQSKIPEDVFFPDLKSKYNEIENFFKQSGNSVSFSYEDLNSGLHISYNEKQQYFCASVIKAPVIAYIYRQYLEGKINFDQIVNYQPSDYVGGSGSIQNEPYGSNYSIRNLVNRTIVESDNIAYQMLAKTLDYQDVVNYWRNLGATTFWSNGWWGQVNSHDGAIYMKELYRLTNENPTIKNELLNLHYNSVFRLIRLDDSNIKIAHKSGWNYATMHDLAIVYDEQPYVLAITTRKGYENYNDFFSQATKLINEFHQIYWEQKSDYCYKKTFSS